ncbi:hypothetical protein DNK57_08055 [Methanothermobacter thermautotrophicus]|uniref:Cation-transporting P-type ATPase N-terminal domain-containing protein n=1 Tax=Methanothermobacter thermautotrophicus TaxID=145262 RepID=A0A842YP10_METTF|nr:cation-translocating P-type ATPase C-terminal domain-containing protein [Methanothermobacter thermautotrophicus]MBE2900738.1 hypothetical protein [Methanothermobacter thermautotrophicus]
MASWKKLSEINTYEVFDELETSSNGLGEAEVSRRLNIHGLNEIRFKKPGPLLRFLKQFQSLLVYVLIVVGVFTAIIGEWIDTVVIAGVVVLNSATNPWVLYGILITAAITLLIIYLPGLEFIFKTGPFPSTWWALIVPFSLTGLLAVEVEKYLMRRWNHE